MNASSKKTTQLAVVGAGLVGKRHVTAIEQLSGVTLSGIVDTSDEAIAFAAENKVPAFASLSDLFNDHKPDGVILSTPTTLHVEQGLVCVDAGCPILVEKPLATVSADGQQLVVAAETAGVPILVGHHRRHNPLIHRAHALINAGELGDIRVVNATCWFYKPDDYFEVAPWRKLNGAGPISVNLVHDVDLVRSFCGEVIKVQAQAAPSARGFENEDVAAAVLTFASGAIATISVSDSVVSPWSWEHTSGEYPIYPVTNESCYLIGGSHGSLSIPDMRLWTHTGERNWWQPISATSSPREASDPLVNQIRHFSQVITEGVAPLVSGREGLKTLQVIESIQQAAATGQTINLNGSQ